MAISYQTGTVTIAHIYRATSGGTVFSSNLNTTSTFDYFDDSAVVDDAIYFGISSFPYSLSKLRFNVGTALSGTDVVIKWEVYIRAQDGNPAGWYEIKSKQDDTNGFTTTGLNSFQFGLPYGWVRTTINGANVLWVRARIDSLTAITEGGANTTNTVLGYDAEVNIDGYSDASPCTFEDVYQYLLTNAPWLTITKIKNSKSYYDFREVVLDCNSRLLSKNEIVEFGFNGDNGSYNGYYDYSYLQMGEKLGTDFGINGSTLIHHTGSNTWNGIVSTNTKFYGSHIYSPSGWGYPTWQAESVFCFFENVNPTPNSSGSFINCLIYDPGVWIINGSFFNPFDKNKVVIFTDSGFASLGLVYNSGFTCRNLDFETTSNAGGMLYFYNSSAPETVVWKFINPARAMPRNDSGGFRMFTRSTSGGTTSWDKVWYFDESAGTYTDYTTQCNSTATDDMPIHGDVGDIYYFGKSGTYLGMFYRIVTGLASNDYEYVWEYYAGGDWRTYDSNWMDTTGNFTITANDSTGAGRNYLARNASYLNLASLNINGYTGFWSRMRIVTKGTGTPMISRLTLGSESGVGKWNAYEQYSLNLKVKNSGSAIEDANVIISLDGTEIFNGQTDANGEITEQELTYTHWYFDPVNYYTNYGKIAEITSNDYDLTITKEGFETYTGKIQMNQQRSLVITLKQAIDTMVVLGKGIVIRADPTNSTQDRDLLI